MSDIQYNRNPFSGGREAATVAPGAAPDSPAPTQPQYVDYNQQALAASRAPAAPQGIPGYTNYNDLALELSQGFAEQRQANLEAFSYMTPVSDMEYGIIRNRLLQVKDSGGDFQAEAYKLATAVEMSRFFGRSVEDTMENFEPSFKAWMGRDFQPTKTNFLAITDSFKSGSLNIELGKTARAWMDGGGTDAALEKKLGDLSAQLGKLQDSQPRPWIIKALEAGAESAPFTIRAAAAGLAGSALVGLTGGAAAPAALGILKAGASMLGSFAESSDTMRGLEYYDMRMQGIAHETAMPAANMSGMFQGAVESLLGNVPGLATMGGAGASIAAKAATKLAVSGAWGAVARSAIQYGGEMIEEGVEEGIQQIISDVIQNGAKDDYGIEVKDAKEIAKGAWESAKGGFMASVVMGLPASVVGGIRDTKEAKALKEYAGTTDRQTFIENASNWKAVESLDEAQKSKALNSIWDSVQQKAKETRQAEATEVAKPFKRTEAGTLYTEETVVSSAEEGRVEAILKVGDAETKERLGYLKYEVTEDGIVIESSRFETGYKSVREEAIMELAAKYPGLPITVAEGASESTRAAVKKLASANPRGDGANWYTEGGDVNVEKARGKLRLAITDKMPKVSTTQREAAIMLHEFRANAMGVKFDKYLENEFSPEIITEGVGKVSAAQGQRAGILFTKDGQDLRIGEFVRDAKALVMVTEKSDFVSFVHESGHLFRKQLIGTDLGTQLEEAYSINAGTWTREHEERFVDDLVKYLSYGEAKDERLKSVFQKISEWITRLWSKVLSQGDVDPRIRAVMDELFKSEQSPLSEAANTSVIAVEQDTQSDAVATPSEQTEEVLFQSETRNQFIEKAARDIDYPLRVISNEARPISLRLMDERYSGIKSKTVEDAQTEMFWNLDVWSGSIYDALKIASNEAKKNNPKQAVLFQYIGERADLDETETQNLSVAKDMAEAGKDNETIRLATGWFKGKYDGKWRMETEDKQSSLVGTWPLEISEEEVFKDLSEVFNSPQAFKKYPELKDIAFSIDNEMDANAAYQKNSPVTYIYFNNKKYTNDWIARQTMIHEVQHAIQDMEGFARGSSPRTMHRTYNDARARLNFVENDPDYKEGSKKLDELWERAFTKDEISNDEAIAQEAEILKQHPAIAEAREILDLLRKYKDDWGFDAYRRTAGEIEARDVASRMGLSPEQRRAMAPYSSEDIAEEDALVLFQSAKDYLAKDEVKASIVSYRDKEVAERNDYIEKVGESIKKYEADGKQKTADFFKRSQQRAAEILEEVTAATNHLLAGNPLFVHRVEESRVTKNGIHLDYAMVHPSSRVEGKFQISRFDRMGPFSHYGPGNLDELLGSMIADGYKPSLNESMDFSEQGKYVNDQQQASVLFQTAPAPDTPEFKAWFGDSKVVDEEGKPLVVYHGTTTGFEKFDVEKAGQSSTAASVGFWFTPEEEFAANFNKGTFYGENKPSVLSVYLAISNPKIFMPMVEDEAKTNELEATVERLKAEAIEIMNEYGWNAMATGKISKEQYESKKEEIKEKHKESKRAEAEAEKYYFRDSYQQFKTDLYSVAGQSARDANIGGLGMTLNNQEETIKKYRERLQAEGYDGILIKGTTFDSNLVGHSNDQYVALYPTQIKSINNRGTWDGADPRILFQTDDATINAEAEKFDTWEAWRDDVEASADFLGDDSSQPEDMTPEERDRWYKGRWEWVHAEKEKKAAEQRVVERKEAVKGDFTRKMEAEGGVESLLKEIWDAEVAAFDTTQASDEDEAREQDKAYEWKKELAQRLGSHSLVELTAQSVGKGKKLKPSTRKAILTYIRNNEVEFASLYAELTGDLDLAQYAESNRKKLQSIPNPKLEKFADMSIAERTALLNAISDKQVRARIKSGDYDDPYLDDYVRRLEEEKKSLTKATEDAEKQIEELGGKLEVESDFAMKMYARSKATAKELEGKEKELDKVQAAKERIETAKASYVEALGSARDESKLSVKIAKKELLAALTEARKEAAFQSRFVAAEIRATAKLKAQRDANRRAILKKPAKNIIFENKQQIKTIQEYLRSKKWEYIEELDDTGKISRKRAYDTVIDADGTKRKVPRYTTVQAENLKAAMSAMLKETPALLKILTNETVDRINEKPVSAWTLAELQDLRKVIDRIAKEGREAYELKKMMEAREAASDRYDGESILRRNKRYKAPAAHGSDEETDMRKKMEGFATWELPVMKMRYLAPIMDGGLDGPHKKVLVDEEYDARRLKQKEVNRRLRKVQTRMRELNMKQKDRQRRITIQGVGPSGNPDVTMTAAKLSHVALILRNKKSRDAYIYGNLFSEYERTAMPKEFFEANGDAKQGRIEKAISDNLTAGELEIIDMIGESFGGEEFNRLNRAVINLTNEEMKQEENYSPIYREGSYFESHNDSIIDAMKAEHGFIVNPASGFTISRIKIGPNHQSPLRVMDIVSMFEDAVDTQEHLISYGAYVKKLHAVYQSQQLSKGIRENIIQTFGKDGMDYIDKYIGAVATGGTEGGSEPGSKALKKLRGYQAVGFLAFRWTSVVKQLITSPLPYMAYAPKETLSAAFQAWGSGHIMKFVEEVEGKSEMLQSRTIDQIFEAVKAMDAEGWEGLVKKVGTTGMKGLELADRISVAIGWKGVYDKARIEGATEEDAIKRADDITFQTQPSANPADLAPIYRDMTEWKKILLMFTSSLNTVYNNIRHGIPKAIREKEYGEAVGIVVSYAIAGTLLGAFAKSLGKDPPPDDPDEWWKHWAFYSMTQFTDSVPLIGSELSSLTKRMVTGEKKTPFGEDTLPTVSAIIKGIDSLSQGDLQKAAESFAEGVGLASGLPTLAIEEAFKDLGSVIDGKGE